MKKTKKKNKKIALLLLLLLVTIGYAILSTNISIIGASKIKDARWDVHLENINVKTGSVEAREAATINQARDSVSYQVDLNLPGDFYEFTVDVVNAGTIDAMIDSVSSKIKINDNDYEEITSNSLPAFLNYQITYSNGSKIEAKQELNSSERKTYKVRIEYRQDIAPSDLPTTEQNIGFQFSINYIQKDDTSTIVAGLETGRYISVIPDQSSYTLGTELTGYTEDQTIQPNELTLWRIISMNEDGTMDAISEYTSSRGVSFSTTTGYKNYVKTLKTIAEQYQNSKYTKNARIVGYQGQTEELQDTSSFDGTKIIPPMRTSTFQMNTIEEFLQGVGGDTYYRNDIEKIKNTYQEDLETYGESGLIAYGVENKDNKQEYYTSSRMFNYTSDNYYNFSCSFVNKKGIVDSSCSMRFYISEWMDRTSSKRIRPIITIKSQVEIESGLGTKEDPYRLK